MKLKTLALSTILILSTTPLSAQSVTMLPVFQKADGSHILIEGYGPRVVADIETCMKRKTKLKTYILENDVDGENIVDVIVLCMAKENG